MDKNLFKTLGDATNPEDKKLTFTVEEMEQCFKAGYDFAKDIFDNPSNSEYVNGIILQKEKRILIDGNWAPLGLKLGGNDG